MKYLLYFEPIDACCKGEDKSQETLLEKNSIVGVAYLVDEITGKEWGDDWNDAPKCGNAGAPYPENCKGLEIVEIRLGKQFPPTSPTYTQEEVNQLLEDERKKAEQGVYDKLNTYGKQVLWENLPRITPELLEGIVVDLQDLENLGEGKV